MNKVIHLSLARKSVPILMDVVQSATAPSIEFVIDDYTPPSNARARIYIKKEGGEVYNNCTLSGNVVTYTPTAGSFDVAGQCVAQLELMQGSTVAVSWRIFVTVEPNLINGSAAPASTEYGALTQLIVNAQRYDGIIGANNITGYNNRQGWTTLTSGQNLNTVTAPGVYSANTNAIATSLNGTPFAYSFKLVVELFQSNTGNYILQTATQTATGEVKRRLTLDNGTSWTDWASVPTRSEVNAIANIGAKNQLPNIVKTTTIKGVTITRNDDGTLTLNGTASETFYLHIPTTGDYYASFPNGTYVLVAGEDIGDRSKNQSGIYLGCNNGSTSYYAKNDNGGKTGAFAVTQNIIKVWLVVPKDTVATDFIVKPMIKPSKINDDTYVPYGMSNAELTEKMIVQALSGYTVHESISNPGSISANKQGSMVVVSFWGTRFSTIPSAGVEVLTGLPRCINRADCLLHLGGASMGTIVGNVYNNNESGDFKITPSASLTVNTAVYGVLVYMTSE